MKKILSISAVVFFNICLLWIALVIPALAMASSPSFYYSQFERIGLYSQTDEHGVSTRNIIPYVGGYESQQAAFTDEQLNAMANHIVRYLFTDMESFELVMDNVYMIHGGECDGVSIFGEQAISHMADVKGLMTFAKWATVCSGVFITALLCLFILKRKHFFKSIFKISRAFYAGLFAFAALFCLWSYIGASDEVPFLLNLWGNVHYLLFAFQPKKYANSFLYDTLTYILTLEFFINAIIIIVAVILATVLLWLTAAKLMEKNARKP